MAETVKPRVGYTKIEREREEIKRTSAAVEYVQVQTHGRKILGKKSEKTRKKKSNNGFLVEIRRRQRRIKQKVSHVYAAHIIYWCRRNRNIGAAPPWIFYYFIRGTDLLAWFLIRRREWFIYNSRTEVAVVERRYHPNWCCTSGKIAENARTASGTFQLLIRVISPVPRPANLLRDISGESKRPPRQIGRVCEQQTTRVSVLSVKCASFAML